MVSSLGTILLVCSCAKAAVVEYEFVIEPWVVNFLRPTKGDRSVPDLIPLEVRKEAFLVNGMYPGPTIEANENDTVRVTVVNKLLGEGTSLHMHGIHQLGTPFMDGTAGVAQAPINPAQNFTYEFLAYPPGTHYWHAHMDALQMGKGLKGPIVVQAAEDPYEGLFDEERVIVLADEWRQPELCLKNEGAAEGNNVCAEIEVASFNGQYGNGTEAYPYQLVEVEQGKCYRLRFIGTMQNAQNFVVTMAGHSMTLLAMDGEDIEPVKALSINVHNGERYDVLLCADQEPGNYLLNATYDLACPLLAGGFIPPGLSEVPACSFFAYLHYKTEGVTEAPADTGGTEGGAGVEACGGFSSDCGPCEGDYCEDFDLNYYSSYAKARPLVPSPSGPSSATLPDATYVVNMGATAPFGLDGDPSVNPLETGRWYMDSPGSRRSWERPVAPLLHTKGTCGSSGAPIIAPNETYKVIDIVVNNVGPPSAHVIHMHGGYFEVINFSDYEWCSFENTDCFFKPAALTPCPAESVTLSDPEATSLASKLYWGCAYSEAESGGAQLQWPVRKDTVSVPRRGFVVLRVHIENPGIWSFHCHMEHHIPVGMMTALNLLPSQQPPIPRDVPTEGPCWESVNWEEPRI